MVLVVASASTHELICTKGSGQCHFVAQTLVSLVALSKVLFFRHDLASSAASSFLRLKMELYY